MNYLRLEGENFVPVSVEDLVEGDRIKKEVIAGAWAELSYSPEQPPEPIIIISKKAFFVRLRQLERKALRESENDDMRDFWDILNLSEYIDLKDPMLIGGLSLAASLNMLTLENGETNEERIAYLLRNGEEHEAY